MSALILAHPAAEIFPLMSGAEFAALVADIREHGQREPIIIHNGEILDGRNRYRACQELHIEPATVEWDGKGNPEAFVVSMNLQRRHLNESQRAMIAARLYSTKAGDNRYTIDAVGIPTTTRARAAELLNVHFTTVAAARKVLAEGTPEEIQAVARGEAAVSTIAKQIRKGQASEKRKATRGAPMAQVGKNPERIQRQQMNAEIWGRVRDALTHLTSLPLAADVVAIARAHDRAGLIDARLSRSLRWLQEFSDGWRDRDETAA